MNQYLALTLLTLSTSIVPGILIPLLLALLLWRARAGLQHALIWLSGAALALGLLDLLLLYVVIFWSQHGTFRTIMPHQDLFPYVAMGAERLLAELSNACTVAAITIGLFATMQLRQRWWAVAFAVGALLLWNTIGANVWGGSLLQMIEILRRWAAVSFSLLAHLVALLPLVYALTQPPRRLVAATHTSPQSAAAQPQPDTEARVNDGIIR
ncbi:MAG: hypothetical protein ACXVCX_10705 [Ktedonobacterales bacterium]